MKNINNSDPERARDALFHIDSGCTREEWVRIGMATKSAGLSFDDFNNWSSSGGNYAGVNDCRTVWKSINESGGVTAATLFATAIKQGWKDTSKPSGRNTANNQASVKKPTDAASIWDICIPAQPSNPYIIRKLGNPSGLTVYPDTAPPCIIKNQNIASYLVVPAWSDEGLQTLQFIPNDGEKLNLPGASFNDGYFIVGEITKKIYVVEGIGQAWAINAAIKSCAIVAFGAGRMAKVAKLLHKKYRDAQLIIVPDKGKESEAVKIAATVSGYCVTMPDDKENNYDVNDYFQEYGKKDLAILLDHAQEPATTSNAILDNEQKYCRVDLLRHLDDQHLLKRLSIYVAALTQLPVNTVMLIGMTIYSSMAMRKYSVAYQNGKTLPIGLYSVAEQPSGTGKSWCIDIFMKPFVDILKSAVEQISKAIRRIENKAEKLAQDSKHLEKSEADELKELKGKLQQINTGLYISNATPEGLETTLSGTNGFFSAISSEQGLFNSLFGMTYKSENKSNNNDITLNGYDGGYVNNKRVSRPGYNGHVVGGIACFAQEGSIEAVLKASHGTGLSERFLMLAEPHTLGTRDHTKCQEPQPELIAEYNRACQFIQGILEKPREMDSLSVLQISKNGFHKINQYRNEIEAHLADGGKYSHISLRGAASKINMQIMKIAATLHLIDDRNSDGQHNAAIDDKHIEAAIGIVNELLEANLKLRQDKGIMGVKAEFTAILSLFENDPRPRTERIIITTKCKANPFKDFSGNKSKLIRETLTEMVAQGLLIKSVGDDGKAIYSLGQ